MSDRRRRIRELAMQILFLWDTDGAGDPAQAQQVSAGLPGIDDEARSEAIKRATAAWEQREVIDRWVERLAPQWPPKRQPRVDLAVLRMAVSELTSGQTPAKVVIDEAVELAKAFSTEQSPGFINAILDAVWKETQLLSGEVKSSTPRAVEILTGEGTEARRHEGTEGKTIT
jgi:N utilization substance protein B